MHLELTPCGHALSMDIVVSQWRRKKRGEVFMAYHLPEKVTATIFAHPAEGGTGRLIWEKTCSTDHNATQAAEAAWNRFMSGKVPVPSE